MTMTNEEAIKRIKCHKIVHKMDEPNAIKISEALDMAIEALSQESSEDIISRQAAIDELDKGAWGVEWDKALAKAMIESLPSAQPERKKGQWMKEDRGHVEYCAVCDQCGFDWIWSDREYFKFCPNCGADMRGKEE